MHTAQTPNFATYARALRQLAHFPNQAPKPERDAHWSVVASVALDALEDPAAPAKIKSRARRLIRNAIATVQDWPIPA